MPDHYVERGMWEGAHQIENTPQMSTHSRFSRRCRSYLLQVSAISIFQNSAGQVHFSNYNYQAKTPKPFSSIHTAKIWKVRYARFKSRLFFFFFLEATELDMPFEETWTLNSSFSDKYIHIRHNFQYGSYPKWQWAPCTIWDSGGSLFTPSSTQSTSVIL